MTLGTNDLPRAIRFYEQVLAPLNVVVVYETDRSKAWSTSPTNPGLSICKPFNEQPATAGNGTMVALSVDSAAIVDAVYNKAIELGGTDEGAPGERFPGYYGAYFRDLDGNKINVHYMAH